MQTWLTGLPCQIGAMVEASVNGVSGSGLRADGILSAAARRDVPVPYSSRWVTSGTHFRGTLFGELFIGNTTSSAQISYQGPPPVNCATDPGHPDCPSPLLIDTRGNGFHLTNARNGVLFDIDGDGQLEQIGWTREGSDDAWLALDRNGNGTIDNGTELFGNYTQTRVGAATASNGFDALRFLHATSFGAASFDNEINASDAAFAQLLLWRDDNHDGISQREELTRVAGSPLTSIDLLYREVFRVRKGNEIKLASSVTWGSRTRRIVDVWVDVLR